MPVEQRRDADVISVRDTPEQRQRTLDAATAYMLHTALVECALYLAGIRGTQAISRERGMAALSEIVSHALFGLEE